MASPNIPASVLAARGKPIKLIDDRVVHVVFTFSSVMRLEDDFGSIAAALSAVEQVESGKAFGSIADILAAGLEHESTDDGARLSNVDVLRYLLDSTELHNYSEQLGAAFEAAFPTPEKSGGDDADPTKGADSSLGQSGTTSPLDSSDEATQSSGA